MFFVLTHSHESCVIKTPLTWSSKRCPRTPNPEPRTRILFIDGNANDRALYVSGLQYCSPDYHIIEAIDGQSGLAIYRAQRIDCVVLELDLPDRSGFEVLVDLVPLVRRPNIAVVVLTRVADRGLYALARENGAYVCFHKPHTSSDDLDRAINRAIGFVGLLPKEDRYQPL
jgi:CheY-like chemotaxis protein